MDRRTFLRGGAGLVSARTLLDKGNQRASGSQNRASDLPGVSSGEGVLDIRGILAMYDNPSPEQEPLRGFWRRQEEGVMGFDARNGRRFDGPFWDRDNWDKYLTLWSQEGYNAVFWFGYNETNTGHHALIRFKQFPEARMLTAERNEKVIAQMKWLFRRAHELGMKNFQYVMLIMYTQAFAKAHGLEKQLPVSPHVAPDWSGSCGVRTDLTNRYIEAAFTEFCEIYEDLDGFLGAMGECLPGDRGTYYKDVIAPVLKHSGRNLPFAVQQWEIPLDEYLRDVASKEIYENTWLSFHAWNSESLTDAKPYPGLVGWAEATQLPTVATLWPANVKWFPLNSPKFASEIAFEMKRIPNFKGFMYWEYGRKLSPLFRKALVHYTQSDEAYSDEPWLALLEDQFGDREAAEHFLNAYNISARIIPEKSALVWEPNGMQVGELQLPYELLTGDTFHFSWAIDPVRTQPLQPLWHYAQWAGKFPKLFRDQNGSDWRIPHGNGYDFQQAAIWRTWGGSTFDIIPPVHMKKVRALGEECLQEAEHGLKTVKKNEEDARRAYNFMKGYKLLSAYYERKVAAATTGLIYSYSHQDKDRAESERLADEALASYVEAATFMHQELDPVVEDLYMSSMKEPRAPFAFNEFVGLLDLIEAEKEDRKNFADIFWTGKHKPSTKWVG